MHVVPHNLLLCVFVHLDALLLAVGRASEIGVADLRVVAPAPFHAVEVKPDPVLSRAFGHERPYECFLLSS